MNVENGTPWKSASMAVALPILVMRTGNGANCRKNSKDAVAACICLMVSEPVICNATPDEAAGAECEALGEALANA